MTNFSLWSHLSGILYCMHAGFLLGYHSERASNSRKEALPRHCGVFSMQTTCKRPLQEMNPILWKSPLKAALQFDHSRSYHSLGNVPCYKIMIPL